MAGWDGGYYTAIARDGYPAHVPSIGGHAAQSVLGFFPLYPLVIRAVSTASGLSINAAAILVANVAGGVAVWLLWLLVRDTFDDQTARRPPCCSASSPEPPSSRWHIQNRWCSCS
jgi:hypothetical protein